MKSAMKFFFSAEAARPIASPTDHGCGTPVHVGLEEREEDDVADRRRVA